MEMATILPQAYLPLIKNQKYHMCLAHLIADDITVEQSGLLTYTDFYKDQCLQLDKYVIMDNGVIEGSPVPINRLLDKANFLGIQEMILPDVFGDGPRTINAVVNALDYLDGKLGQFNLMAIPHGRTIDQWVACAKQLLEFSQITCLGVPKLLTMTCGRDARLHAIAELANSGAREVNYHLLGCNTSPLEVTIIAKASDNHQIPMVRGCDSVIAYKFAQHGLRFCDDDRPESLPIDFADGTLAEDVKHFLPWNIQAWQDAGDVSKNKNVWFI